MQHSTKYAPEDISREERSCFLKSHMKMRLWLVTDTHISTAIIILIFLIKNDTHHNVVQDRCEFYFDIKYKFFVVF